MLRSRLSLILCPFVIQLGGASPTTHLVSRDDYGYHYDFSHGPPDGGIACNNSGPGFTSDNTPTLFGLGKVQGIFRNSTNCTLNAPETTTSQYLSPDLLTSFSDRGNSSRPLNAQAGCKKVNMFLSNNAYSFFFTLLFRLASHESD